jgi:hypothetical protein
LTSELSSLPLIGSLLGGVSLQHSPGCTSFTHCK